MNDIPQNFNNDNHDNDTGKNIVVMCDGTWNSPNSRTNVYVLYKELLERDYEQHVKYLDGVGIGDLLLGFILDGVIAVSIDKKIKEGYKYIATHYNPGDNVWLFGFSRGAYTARCIAGMIENNGILKIERDITSEQIDDRVNIAYDNYRNRDTKFNPDGSGSIEFKNAFSYPDSEKLIIKFLGLWDTVGAYGLPGYVIGKGFEYLEFNNQKVPKIVNYACQALAIHERTSFFEPCHINPSSSSSKTIIKETWFPGVHMEIGGGTFLSFGGNERISKATILWMIENIEQVGGLLMRDDINTYRTRFSPDDGPSWNIKNLIFDRSNALIPTLMLRDRVIPYDLDPSGKFLRKDLFYRDSDWSSLFGSRTHLTIQYISNTYEDLRKFIETRGIRLHNDVKYDKETIDTVSEWVHQLFRTYLFHIY